MWNEPARWDAGALAARWRDARPFPHLVLDDLCSPEGHSAILAAFADEPMTRIHDEIFEVLASSRELEQPSLRRFHDELGGDAVRAAVGRISGKALGRVEARAYAYLP